MRYITAQKENRTFIGITDEQMNLAFDLSLADKAKHQTPQLPETMIECITLGEDFLDLSTSLQQWIKDETDSDKYTYPLNQIKLLAPIPRPTKNIFCIGKNYKDHVLEMGSSADLPTDPIVFTKPPTAVIGQKDIILNHKQVTDELDYEGELAVVIGKKGTNISPEQALDYVFGYTIINDITARDLQKKHKQFFIGKSLDSSCPMGPVIVHKKEIDSPNNLNIQTKVNGEVRQNAKTDLFIFDVETIISILSKGLTLEPGDIIATGTPAGVGKGFNPPRLLQPGDEIEIEVEKIGVLKNTVEG
ncbi:fumarylacetoacetate hydrolase family protein [Chengkuizengella axinellae]|uniref:Fumarylacetoacetate hydrolase family protein n=1 Tax=Chengkuizengella axinellae TaxID=3064388 RepID=A0ABT9J3N1_9BACL|nr:fumarylacetoacetate hydrolase family protein [Chengkuizengella sp. 2205SS18-9]MDP5276216.1 fumarylacetoacetate hydrolase family protein [Chengkuizengella sp. 2205SS18-9]